MANKIRDIMIVARRLFMKHGISRISIEEVCREAKVSKMTFYRNFNNKVDLAIKVIDDLMDEAERDYRAILDENSSYRDKVQKMIHMKFEGTTDFSREFFEDIRASDIPELRAHLERRIGERIKLSIQDLVKAQNDGLIRKDIKPEFLLYIVNKMQEMLADEELNRHYGSLQEAVMELTNFFFYGLGIPTTESD